MTPLSADLTLTVSVSRRRIEEVNRRRRTDDRQLRIGDGPATIATRPEADADAGLGQHSMTSTRNGPLFLGARVAPGHLGDLAQVRRHVVFAISAKRVAK